jgi:hypothetical protein
MPAQSRMDGRQAPARQPLARQLRDLLAQLQQVQSAVMVSVLALRSQACELDEDIARVLQRAVAERLHEQMDRLEASLLQLGGSKPGGH